MGHKENILVSKHNNNKCYLIDFNQMFNFMNITHVDSKEFRGILSLQTPTSWKYLATHSDRNKYLRKYGNHSFYKLKQFAHQSQKYKTGIFMLETLLKSKSIKSLEMNEN